MTGRVDDLLRSTFGGRPFLLMAFAVLQSALILSGTLAQIIAFVTVSLPFAVSGAALWIIEVPLFYLQLRVWVLHRTPILISPLQSFGNETER